MIYPLKSRPRPSAIFGPLIIVGVISLVCGLMLFFAPSASSSVGTFFATPVWSFRDFLGNKFSYVGTFFTSRETLLAENTRLQVALDKANGELVSYDVLSDEHQKLLALYGRTDTHGQMLAVVIAKPPQSAYDTLVIDIGAEDQVAVGDSVYGLGNAVLGTVSSVDARTAAVTLFSSGGRDTPAIVERSNLSLMLSGTGGGGFEAKVPQDVDVLVGDTIILPALRSSVLGRVAVIESTDTSSFKRVVVQSPVNINNLRWVEVSTQK